MYRRPRTLFPRSMTAWYPLFLVLGIIDLIVGALQLVLGIDFVIGIIQIYLGVQLVNGTAEEALTLMYNGVPS